MELVTSKPQSWCVAEQFSSFTGYISNCPMTVNKHILVLAEIVSTLHPFYILNFLGR